MKNYLNEKFQKLSENKNLFWILVAGALATRFIGVKLGGTGGNRGDDDGMLLNIAQNFLNEGTLYMYWQDLGPLYSFEPPGMPLFHILFISLFKNYWLAERIFFLLMSSLAFPCFYYLAQRYFSRPVALIATVILILYPPQWFWSTRINGHTYATNMVILALTLLFVSWERKNLWQGLLVGLMWGSLSLMRPEYLPGIFILAGASYLTFKSDSFGRKLGLTLLLGWTIVLGPWATRNYLKTGKFTLSSTHYSYNLWMVFNPGYTFGGDTAPSSPELEEKLAKVSNSEPALVDIWVNEAKTYIRENPKAAAHHVFVNFFNYWRPWLSFHKTPLKENLVYIVSWVPIFLFFLVALFKIPFRDPKWLMIGGLLLYKTLAQLPFYMIVRFREAVFPLLLLVATYSFSLWLTPTNSNK